MSNVSKKSETITRWKKCRDCGCRFKDSMTSFLGIFPVRISDFKTDNGQCPECRKKEQLRYEKLFFARDLHWTFESVKDYFTENPPYLDQELIVLDTSHRMNTYALVKVINPEHTKQKRIVIKGHSNGYSGMSFYRSGKNCFSPTGQVRLLPYHSKIGALIKEGKINEIQLSLEEIIILVGEVEQTTARGQASELNINPR